MQTVMEKQVDAVIEKASDSEDNRSYTITIAHINQPDKEDDIFRKYESEDEYFFHHDWNHARTAPIGDGKLRMVGEDVKHDITLYTSPEASKIKEIYDSRAGKVVRFSYRFYVPEGVTYSRIETDNYWPAFDYSLVKVYESSPVDLPATYNTGIDGKDLEARKELAKSLDPKPKEELEVPSDSVKDQEQENSEKERILNLQYQYAKANYEYYHNKK